jgi:hypothetical protein
MSILVRFTGAPTVTTEQYDETLQRLEESGGFPPTDLSITLHLVRRVAFGSAKFGTRRSSLRRLVSVSCQSWLRLALSLRVNPKSSRSTTPSSVEAAIQTRAAARPL